MSDQLSQTMNGVKAKDPISPRDWAPKPEAFVQGNESAVADVKQYLEKFGHLESNSTNDSEKVEEALKDLQKLAGIAQTGIYDADTASFMNIPRCSVPDHSKLSGPPAKKADFVASSAKWNKTNLTYRFDNVTSDFNGSEAYVAIQMAMSRWSNLSPLTFTEVLGSADADIVIKWAVDDHGDGSPFDGKGNILAHGFYPPPLGNPFAGQLHFDDAEDWNFPFLHAVALHELGHVIGLEHSTVKDAVMWPQFQGTSHLHPDDIMGLHSLYGMRQPIWELLDNNHDTVSIHAASSGIGVTNVMDGLYQRHNSGRIWHYTGPPMTGWTLLDQNPGTLQITASGGQVYQRRSNGDILQYTGTPLTGWQEIALGTAAVDILASGTNLYMLGSDGHILQYEGTPSNWTTLDTNPGAVQLTASTNGQLYQRQRDGKIWKYSGTPMVWQLLDGNPACIAIAAGGDNVYQLHNSGNLWVFTGLPSPAGPWITLDTNPKTISIAAAGNFLYQTHSTGVIWRYTGTPGVWEEIDGNPAITSMVVDDNGSVWQWQQQGAPIYRLNS